MTLLLGCIADDITGATDLGLMLNSNGMPTTLYLGVPGDLRVPRTQAVVIAQKIRSCPPEQAVREASCAADWLLAHGARQLFYKYCSTFDSTGTGNIGPVTEALLRRVDSDQTVLLPSFPENGRTVRGGHLYVDEQLLSDSSMRHHPLNPMTESFIPALMDAQTSPGSTGWVGQEIVNAGADRLRAALSAERSKGHRYVSVDTRGNEDLPVIAEAISDMLLVTGGSGIAAALPAVLQKQGLLPQTASDTALPGLPGHAAVLVGSCSEATRAQIADFSDSATTIVIDPIALHDGSSTRESVASAAQEATSRGHVLVCSSTAAEDLRRSQAQLGVAVSARLVEDALAHVARHLADNGVSKFVVAGGETSGAVAQALEVRELRFGKAIAPGVPWMTAQLPKQMCLAFKSGNFGSADFFGRALEMLP